MKYVFITGGVTSSLGKGVTSAALGRLLKARGYSVSLQKLDLYYNAESSFMSPLEHGEAFITDDGCATDLDLGNYERFVDVSLPGTACCTTGKIHRSILERELRGEYHGCTIQAIPHVTNEIKSHIRTVAESSGCDICIVEIGGTVGDMEASVYLEAIRQMRLECEHPYDCCYVHLTLMPYISTAGELKTKPSQNSVKALRSVGIQPDVIVCRSEVPVSSEAKDKIALFCNVKATNVIQNLDVDMLYELPLVLEKEGLARAVVNELKLENRQPELDTLKDYVRRAHEASQTLHVAVVGKYTAMPDAYLSVTEAINHAAIQNGARAETELIDSEKISDENALDILGKYSAIIVPGGYGKQGTEGMIAAAKFARENNIPFLGIAFGMQMAVVEAVRGLLGLEDANSLEVDQNTANGVAHVPEYRVCENDSRKAARMGRMAVRLNESKLLELYGTDTIEERHNNRYEIDEKYVPMLEEKGLHMAGVSVETGHPEAFEMVNHPFYAAVLYHPEFISRPNKPHPLFDALIKAGLKARG